MFIIQVVPIDIQGCQGHHILEMAKSEVKDLYITMTCTNPLLIPSYKVSCLANFKALKILWLSREIENHCKFSVYKSCEFFIIFIKFYDEFFITLQLKDRQTNATHTEILPQFFAASK